MVFKMIPLSSTERSRRSRYLSRLESALDRIHGLVGERQFDDFDVDRLDLTHNLNLISLLGKLLKTPENWKFLGSQLEVSYSMPLSNDFVKNLNLSALPAGAERGRAVYKKWINREVEQRFYEIKMSRGTFCQEYLDAKMTNPRWSWVGIKEPSDNHYGALFLFVWEHKHDWSSQEQQKIVLFPSQAQKREGKRKHPGHSDALKNIQRVIDGELIPYIIWQEAKDETAANPELSGIRVDVVNECKLEVDNNGNWTAVVGEFI